MRNIRNTKNKAWGQSICLWCKYSLLMRKVLISICRKHFVWFYYMTFLAELPTFTFDIVSQIVCNLLNIFVDCKRKLDIIERPEKCL